MKHSEISDIEFWRGRLGIQVSYSKRLNQGRGVIFEFHTLKDGADGVFIGLSYGITIFSNKNYTAYGKD
ncbi:hypothetical protein F3J23_20740 [Chryseobacterium sp. Tr-659]|uniref:hypothetical protein n=1 Tax=Chryseobacterium sp. Tr-659 TaxID=2608340 RepID=UPI001424277D|nr:hypothetical protein [Chryseobacterium sp. Tr-659]NIF07860.1 hypothetical protein [Chryseobacterium sp. Tr-659]